MCSMARRRAACRVTRGLPLIPGDVEVGAQRPPHLTGIHTVVDGLLGSASTEPGQHVVHQQRRTADGTELGFNEFAEFRQPHPVKATGRP